MEKKTKFIIMGLAGILLISILINLQTIGSKQALERQIYKLDNENVSLRKQNDEIAQEKRRLENMVGALNQDLERVSKDKEEIQKKYELVDQAREKLVEQLKSLKAKRMEVAETPALPQTQTEGAYWAGILQAKTELQMQLENIRRELKTIQINNEQLQRDKSSLDLEINSLNRENQDLKRQLEYNQKIMDSISQEFVREKNDKFQIQESLKTIKNENSLLRRQLKSLNNRKIDLDRKLADMQARNTSFENRLDEMGTLLKDKMLQIDNLKNQLEVQGGGVSGEQEEKESVELPPIVVRPQMETTAPSEIFTAEGKVLAVNRGNNFVIIDLGEDAGIKAGDNFRVYRQTQPIASIEVIQTRKAIAACDIKKESTPITVGDTIR